MKKTGHEANCLGSESASPILKVKWFKVTLTGQG